MLHTTNKEGPLLSLEALCVVKNRILECIYRHHFFEKVLCGFNLCKCYLIANVQHTCPFTPKCLKPDCDHIHCNFKGCEDACMDALQSCFKCGHPCHHFCATSTAEIEEACCLGASSRLCASCGGLWKRPPQVCCVLCAVCRVLCAVCCVLCAVC
jgi:hypothetical protein